MWYALCIFTGLLLGFIISSLIHKSAKGPKSIGTLNIVESDDGPPYLFIELDEPAYHLYNQQTVSMNIKAVHTNSQK